MKSLKIAKFQILDTIRPIGIFYGIFLIVIMFLAVSNVRSGGNISSSGIEMASAVFLLIAGLNSFKSNFRFSQANNISRKALFKGLILAVFPIAFAMSVIDLIINRVYNVFVNCPTNFDTIYGSYRDTGMRDWNTGSFVWTQANDIYTLLSTIIWNFAVYSMIFLLGILITLVYYRSNTIMKVIVSIIPTIVITLTYNIFTMLPASFRNSIGSFITGAFGWQSRNPYMAVLSFGVLGVIFTGLIYLLTKKAVVKE
ncbi:MAG: hypothetical protein ACOYWZ_10715 [Bacillota bacterium]